MNEWKTGTIREDKMSHILNKQASEQTNEGKNVKWKNVKCKWRGQSVDMAFVDIDKV